MGELHLEIIVDRLVREFKVEAYVGRPQVAYRETIAREADAEGKYIRQTGGRGAVRPRLAARRAGRRARAIVFEDATVGGVGAARVRARRSSGACASRWRAA